MATASARAIRKAHDKKHRQGGGSGRLDSKFKRYVLLVSFIFLTTLALGITLSDDDNFTEAADYNINLNIRTGGTGYTFSGDALTFNTGANGNTYVITQDPNSGTLTRTISFSTGVTTTVTLNGINISGNGNGNIFLNGTANVTLLLEGDNRVTSPQSYYDEDYYGEDDGEWIYYRSAAVRVPNTSTLTINSASGDGSTSGSLTASSDSPGGGAGIGGDETSPTAGPITIRGGTVTATGYGSAGIGGGDRGNGGNITISGGDVTATGNSGGAGIGGGTASYGGGVSGSGGNITITGGTVTATGSGAGIGGGNSGYNSCDGGSGGNITIAGGTVTAKGGTAGIGGGSGGQGDTTGYKGGSAGTIKITGGTVTATGGPGNVGIGGGPGGRAGGNSTSYYGGAGGDGSVTISGGKVTAIGGPKNITNIGGSGIGGGYGGINGYNMSNRGPSGNLTLSIDNSADVRAHSSTEAISASSVTGDGYFINANLHYNVSNPTTLYLYNNGYSGSPDGPEKLKTVEVPANYGLCAFTTGAASAGNYNIYLDYNGVPYILRDYIAPHAIAIPSVLSTVETHLQAAAVPTIGDPAAVNIDKDSADLTISSVVNMNGYNYVGGGYKYSTTVNANGKPNGAITTLNWPSQTETSMNTGDVLQPNTKYYVEAFLTFSGLLAGNTTYESSVKSFTTPPYISDAYAEKNGSTADITADFTGGSETLTQVVIYWDTVEIHGTGLGSFPVTTAYYALDPSDYDYTGFTDFQSSIPYGASVYWIVIQVAGAGGTDTYDLMVGGKAVTFDPNGGTITKPDSSTTTSSWTAYFEEGTLATAPNVTAPMHYVLDGWYTTADIKWDFAMMLVAEDITLKAKYSLHSDAVIVTLLSTGAPSPSLTYAFSAGSPVAYTASFHMWKYQTLILTTTEPAGYEIVRWQDSIGNIIVDGSTWAGPINMSSYGSAVTFTAVLCPENDKMTVTLESNPAGAETSIKYTIGSLNQQTYAGAFTMIRSETLDVDAPAVHSTQNTLEFFRWQDSVSIIGNTAQVSDIPMPQSPGTTTAKYTAVYALPADIIEVTLETDSPSVHTFTYAINGMVGIYSGPFEVIRSDILVVTIGNTGTDEFLRWKDSSNNVIGQVTTVTPNLSPYTTEVTFTAMFALQNNKVMVTLLSDPAGAEPSMSYTISGLNQQTYAGAFAMNRVGETLAASAPSTHSTQNTMEFVRWENTAASKIIGMTPQASGITMPASGAGVTFTALYSLPADLLTIYLDQDPSGTGASFSFTVNTTDFQYSLTGPFKIRRSDSLSVTSDIPGSSIFVRWQDQNVKMLSSTATASTSGGIDLTDYSGSAAFTALFTMGSDPRVTAVLDSVPAGIGLEYAIGSGSYHTYTQTLALIKGEVLHMRAPLTATVGSLAYNFHGWSGCDILENDVSCPVTADSAFTASYIGPDDIRIVLSSYPISLDPDFGVSQNSIDMPYSLDANGNRVFVVNKYADFIIAAPASSGGYTFKKWLEGGSTDDVRTVPAGDAADNQVYTAYYLTDTAAGRTELTATASPSAGGSFTYTIGGMPQGPFTSGTLFNKTDAVTVTAVENPGYTFLFWDNTSTNKTNTPSIGGASTVRLDLTAYFLNDNDNVTITLEVYPSAGGSVRWNIGTMSNSFQYTAPFKINRTDALKLMANENSGYEFRFWEDGSDNGVRNAGTHTADKTYTAYFLTTAAADKVSVELEAYPQLSGAFEWSLPGMTSPQSYGGMFEVNSGDILTVKASPADPSDYTFSKWLDVNTALNPRTVDFGLVSESSVTLTAYFLTTAVADQTVLNAAAYPSAGGSFTYTIGGMPQGPFTSGTFNKTDTVTVTAAEASGYDFKRWLEDMDTANPKTVDLNVSESSVTVTAYFLSGTAGNKTALTANAYPLIGGTFEYSLNNIDQGAFVSGTEFNKSDAVVLEAIGAQDYGFKRWLDNNTDTNPRAVDISGPAPSVTVTAYFLTSDTDGQTKLNVTASPPAGGTFAYTLGGFPVGTYVSGTVFNKSDQVVITASANPTYTFTRWLDNALEPAARNVTSLLGGTDLEVNLTARFLGSSTADLTLASYPAGAAFEYKIAGADTWSNYSGTPVPLNPGDTVNVQVKAAPSGYTFRFWENGSDNGYRTYEILTDTTMTAYFLLDDTDDRVKVTLTSSPLGAGTFGWKLPGMTADIPYTVPFFLNQSDDLTVTASPAGTYAFKRWLDDSSVNAARNIGTAAADKEYTAYFLDGTPADQTVLYAAEYPAGAGQFEYKLNNFFMGAFTTGTIFNKSDKVEITALPVDLSDYTFSKWLDNTSEANPRIVSLTGSDPSVTVKAYFAAVDADDRVTLTATAYPSAGGTFTYSLWGVEMGPFTSDTFNNNDLVVITPVPVEEDDYEFITWLDDGSAPEVRTVDLDVPGETAFVVKAYFRSTEADGLTQLVASSVPSAGGTFEYTLWGADMGAFTAGTFNKTDQVTVKAVDNPNYTFNRWLDALGEPRDRTVGLNVAATSVTVTAYFLDNDADNRITLNATALPSAGGSFTHTVENVAVPGTFTTGVFNRSDVVKVTPAAASGYDFNRWLDISSNASSRTADFSTTAAAVTMVGYFLDIDTDDRITLNATARPSGGGSFTHTVEGVAVPGTFTTGVFNRTDAITVTAVDNPNYTFNRWLDADSDDNPRTVGLNVSSDMVTVTAYFLDDVQGSALITLNSYPSGGTFRYKIDNTSEIYTYYGPARFSIDEELDIIAYAPSGYSLFKHWENGSTSASRTHTVSADAILSAFFLTDDTDGRVTLTATAYPSAGGSFTHSIAGVAIAGQFTSGTFNKDDAVAVTPVAASGYDFNRWLDIISNDDPRTVNLNVPGTTAFVMKGFFLTTTGSDQKTLTATAYPAAGGSFTYTLYGDDMGAFASGVFNRADVITVTAVDNQDYTFDRWLDAPDEPRTRTVGLNVSASSVTVTAYFLDGIGGYAMITMNSYPSGGTFEYAIAGVSGTFAYTAPARFNIGDDLTVTASYAGYSFKHWEDMSLPAVRTHTVSGDRTLSAFFLSTDSDEQVTLNAMALPSAGGLFTHTIDNVPIIGSFTTGTFNRTDVVKVTPVAASGYTFDRWLDISSEADPRTADFSDLDITEVTMAGYFLDDIGGYAMITMNSHPSGGTFEYSVNGVPVTYTYYGPDEFNIGDSLGITAIAPSGYSFQFWENASTSPYRTHRVQADAALTAYFLNNTDNVKVTLTSYPAVAGAFEWKLDGMTQTMQYTMPFFINKTDDLTVIALPLPAGSYSFRFWEDASTYEERHIGASDEDKEYTAYFLNDTDNVKVTLTASPAGAGTFEWKLYGMTQTMQYTGPFFLNRTDGLTAIASPAAGYIFQFWEDGSDNLVRNIGASAADTEYTATFQYSAPAVVYFEIQAGSDSGTDISPSGNVQVIREGRMTFAFSAKDGYSISSVLVDSVPLTDAEIALGSYTFWNVIHDHRIQVVSGDPAVLSITVASGSGDAMYSIDGSGFEYYTSAVTIPHNANVTVRAVADDGYAFQAWWEGGDMYSTSDVSMAAVKSSVHMDLYFDDAPFAPAPGDNTLWYILGAVILLLAAGLLIWFLFFYRRGYLEVVKVSSSDNIAGKDKARKNKEYVFTVNGSGTVTYRIGDEGAPKSITPDSEGHYVIPKEDVIGKITIELR